MEPELMHLDIMGRLFKRIVDEADGKRSSESYPIGGMIEPYDMAKDEEIMKDE